MVKPPSVILKEFFSSLQGSTPTEAMVHQKTLLPVAEVELWLEHLKTVETNCKRGATKAAHARKQRETTLNLEAHVYKCGVCQEEELWVGCESCVRWFHAVQCVQKFVCHQSGGICAVICH